MYTVAQPARLSLRLAGYEGSPVIVRATELSGGVQRRHKCFLNVIKTSLPGLSARISCAMVKIVSFFCLNWVFE
jgi:hypothetical protein